MISILFIALAAMFNAAMDRTEEPVHFNKSIFRLKNKMFWLKSESWKSSKMIFGWRFDAWHVSKSCMVIFMVGAVVFYKSLLPYYLDILLFGAVWNIVFNVFYNRVFKWQ